MTFRFPSARAALSLAVGLTLAASTSTALAQSTPAKKELVQKVLTLQQPSFDGLARGMVEQPVQVLGQQVNAVLVNRVPADQREAVAKDIQAEFNKYGDEVGPIVRDRAQKLAPGTLGPILEEKLSEDELKQVVGALESPGFRKFMALNPELQRALAQKLSSELQPSIEPKIKAMEQAVSKRLAAAAPAAAARPAASGPKK